MKAYLGADWDTKVVRCALALGTQPGRAISGAGPTFESVSTLLKRARARHPQATELIVVLESGAVQWARLFHAAGAAVHLVDSKQARRFAESLCSSGAKDDKRDALALAQMGRSPGHCPERWEPPTVEQEALLLLGATHERLTRRLTQTIQQLGSILRTTMPFVAATFGPLTSKWVLRFVEQAPTLEHLQQLDQTTFNTLVRGGCRSARREALWEAIQQTHGYNHGAVLSDLMAVEVRNLAAQIRLLRMQKKTLDAKIRQQLDATPNTEQLESIKGIGPQLCLALHCFGLLGTPGSDRDTAAIRMGAAPVFRGSGTTRKGTPKGHVVMRRSASSHARKATYLLGRMASMHTSWGQAMYADGRHRGQRAATVYRRIARCLLRILNALLRDGTSYDEDAYIEGLKRRGVPWAMAIGAESEASAA